ncbi:MAG: hypothetical protein ACRDHN_02460 [Thermomicrobiales bacterium]
MIATPGPDGDEVLAVCDEEPGDASVSDWLDSFFSLRDRLIDPNDPEVQNYMADRQLNTSFTLRTALDICDEDGLKGK